MNGLPELSCPLCEADRCAVIHTDPQRSYFECNCCGLIYVPSAEHVSREDELAVYGLHENSPDDPDYRRFLSRVSAPVTERVPRGSRGLDFGCGPGPTLSVMLEEAGYPTACFDPYFADDTSVLDVSYDFVVCTEVVEHFCRPAQSWQQLFGLVRPGGLLAVMTCRTDTISAFGSWYYRTDPTHVAFYSDDTMRWLAEHYEAEAEFIDDRVTLFTVREDSGAATANGSSGSRTHA